MVNAMTKQLGYVALLNSVYKTNVRVQTSGRKIAAVSVVGELPRAGYVNGLGWADETLVRVDFTSAAVPTFTQMIHSNRSHL